MNAESEYQQDHGDHGSLNDLFSWVKWMAFAFFLAVIALFVVGFVTAKNFNEQRDRDKAQDKAQRIERTVESCYQYNRDQTVNRVAAHKKIFALARLAGRDFNEETLTDEQRVRVKEYDSEMASLYAYRNCSQDCVAAYLSKDLADCPPSESEDGT